MNSTVAKWILAPVIAITALSYSSSRTVEAKTVFPAYGGSGDRSITYECPKGEYLIGISGRAGMWIDKIKLHCAEVLASGAWGHRTNDMPAKGGSGGTPVRVECPDNSYISSTTANVLNNRSQVGYVEYQCYMPANGKFIKDKDFRFGAFSKPDQEEFKATCPSGEMGKGAIIRYGKHVNAFGLICANFNIPKK